MSEPKQSLEEALFELAAHKPAAGERAAFLEGACRDNPTLRARLDLLLEGHFASQGFPNSAPEQPEPAATPKPTLAVKFAEEPPDEAVGQTLGRYKLLERVGEGGCGGAWR